MAECIAKWSVVDTHLGYLFISLLRSNEGLGAALYGDFESAKAKSNAIKALAVASLSADENDLISRLLKHVSSQQKTRDKLAHWLIGTSEDLPDSLILVNPKSAWAALGETQQYWREAPHLLENKLTGKTVPEDEVYAYDLNSLRSDRDGFFKLSILLTKFIKMVSSDPENQTRHQLYAELNQDARLAKRIAR